MKYLFWSMIVIGILGFTFSIISQLGRKHQITLKEPTIEQVQELLAENKADEITGNAACIYRVESLNNYAEEKGYQCWTVLIDSKNHGIEMGHALVAFPTREGELIFIEPKFDQKVQCYKGFDYASNFENGIWGFCPYFIDRLVVIK